MDGTLAYLSGTTGWVMSGDSGNRRPLLLEGSWTAVSSSSHPMGSCCCTHSKVPKRGLNHQLPVGRGAQRAHEPTPIELGVQNIVHFADFGPRPATPTASPTRLPRPAPGSPGWQANNDLVVLTFVSSGRDPRARADPGGQFRRASTAGGGHPRVVGRRHPPGVRPAGRDRHRRPGRAGPRAGGRYDPIPIARRLGLGAGRRLGAGWAHAVFRRSRPASGLESPAASPVFDLGCAAGPRRPGHQPGRRTGMFAYPAVSPRGS